MCWTTSAKSTLSKIPSGPQDLPPFSFFPERRKRGLVDPKKEKLSGIRRALWPAGYYILRGFFPAQRPARSGSAAMRVRALGFLLSRF